MASSAALFRDLVASHVLTDFLSPLAFIRFSTSAAFIHASLDGWSWRELCFDFLIPDLYQHDDDFQALCLAPVPENHLEWRKLFYKHAAAATIVRNQHPHYEALELHSDRKVMSSLKQIATATNQVAHLTVQACSFEVERKHIGSHQTAIKHSIAELPQLITALQKHDPSNPKSVSRFTKIFRVFCRGYCCDRCNRVLHTRAAESHPVVLRCGHQFCDECYRTWVVANQRCTRCTEPPEKVYRGESHLIRTVRGQLLDALLDPTNSSGAEEQGHGAQGEAAVTDPGIGVWEGVEHQLAARWGEIESTKDLRVNKVTAKLVKMRSKIEENDNVICRAVSKAYRRLSKIHHPDKNRSGFDPEKWAAIDTANKLLKEKVTREQSYHSTTALRIKDDLEQGRKPRRARMNQTTNLAIQGGEPRKCKVLKATLGVVQPGVGTRVRLDFSNSTLHDGESFVVRFRLCEDDAAPDQVVEPHWERHEIARGTSAFVTRPLAAGWCVAMVSKSNSFGEGEPCDEVQIAVEPPLSAEQRAILEEALAEEASKAERKRVQKLRQKRASREARKGLDKHLALHKKLHVLVELAVEVGSSFDWEYCDDEEDESAIQFAALAFALGPVLEDVKALDEEDPVKEVVVDIQGATWFVENFGHLISTWPSKLLHQTLTQIKAARQRIATIESVMAVEEGCVLVDSDGAHDSMSDGSISNAEDDTDDDIV